jgi:hypothetical protein
MQTADFRKPGHPLCEFGCRMYICVVLVLCRRPTFANPAILLASSCSGILGCRLPIQCAEQRAACILNQYFMGQLAIFWPQTPKSAVKLRTHHLMINRRGAKLTLYSCQMRAYQFPPRICMQGLSVLRLRVWVCSRQASQPGLQQISPRRWFHARSSVDSASHSLARSQSISVQW